MAQNIVNGKIRSLSSDLPLSSLPFHLRILFHSYFLLLCQLSCLISPECMQIVQFGKFYALRFNFVFTTDAEIWLN